MSLARALSSGEPFELILHQSFKNPTRCADRGTTSVPVPWQTTIINPAYRSVVNSWNIDLTVAARSVVAGSVTAEWANITANGTQSVTLGFVIQAAPGAL